MVLDLQEAPRAQIEIEAGKRVPGDRYERKGFIGEKIGYPLFCRADREMDQQGFAGARCAKRCWF